MRILSFNANGLRSAATKGFFDWFAAQDADWGPIRHQDRLHDRASYRYYWSVLKQARATGITLQQELVDRFFD